MVQYMKAIRATLTTSQPVISEDDFHTMFFKIEELNNVHGKFLADLKEKQRTQVEDIQVGELSQRGENSAACIRPSLAIRNIQLSERN